MPGTCRLRQHGQDVALERAEQAPIAIEARDRDATERIEVRPFVGVGLEPGTIVFDIGQPEQYRFVEASVRAGDLTAAPFKVSKGGLLRSFTWTGKGPYSLKVKLFAGDLTLR